MEEKVEVKRRILGGCDVRVEITRDGKVHVFGAKEIIAHFFYEETEDGLAVVPEKDGVRKFTAKLSAGGFGGGIDAVLETDGNLIPFGFNPGYSLSLMKLSGAWRVDARDGIGCWHERHEFKELSRA